MCQTWIGRLFAVMLMLSCLTTPAWAHKRETRLPLAGCKGHFAATGTATSKEVWAESNTVDHRELVFEVRNVPLTPGTVLVVYLDDAIVGNITLDSNQKGSLKLTSAHRKRLPMLNWGSSVVLTKVDGSIIMW